MAFCSVSVFECRHFGQAAAMTLRTAESRGRIYLKLVSSVVGGYADA